MRDYLEYNQLENLYTENEILFGNFDSKKDLTYIITTYNRYDLLKRCVSSIINQDKNENFSILISDNNSDSINDYKMNPNKYEFFKKKNIIYSVNKKNIGGGANCNQAVLLAKTKYVCIVHDDDIVHPNHYICIEKILKDNKDIKYYCCGAKRIYLNKNEDLIFLNSNIKNTSTKKISFRKLYDNYYCPMLGSLIDREAYINVGGLGSKSNMEDYVFSYKIVEKYSGLFSNKGVYGYTIFNNDSFNIEMWNDILPEKFFLRKYIKKKHKFLSLPNSLLLARDIAYCESKRNITKMRLDKKYILEKTKTNKLIAYIMIYICKAIILFK